VNNTNRAREIIDIEIEGLRKVQANIGTDFEKAVEIILDRLGRGGKIVVTGIGKNLHVGQKIAATLTSTGSPTVVLHPLEALHGDVGIIQPNDVIIAMSYSGESEEVINLLPSARRMGAVIIAMTGVKESTLVEHSDAMISVAVAREACPFNMAPTASTTATMAIGDALAVVLLEARGFKKEDYARLHPSGAIGRALLLRAGDIMRTDTRLASVTKEASVKDAVLAMSSARAGSVAVVDEEQHVVGILTDGDLRRHLTDDKDITNMCVGEIMTPDPITLTTDHLAVDVLALYEQHNIDDLLIVDEADRLIGTIDIQDLPKLKIF